MATEAGELRLFDTATDKELRRFEPDAGARGPFGGPTLSPDGKTLVASAGESLRVWDADTAKARGDVPSRAGRFAFSRDGKLLACIDRKAVQLFESESFFLVHKLRFGNARPRNSRFGPARSETEFREPLVPKQEFGNEGGTNEGNEGGRGGS